jgi:hypothetical protein
MPRRTLERYEPLARDNFNPLKGTGVRRSPRGPFETKRAPRAPMPRCITDQRLGGWLAQALDGRRCQAGGAQSPPAPFLISAPRVGSPRPLDGRERKDGAAQAPPRTALLIRGSKPDPRRVRTGAPDRRSQGRRGHAHSSRSLSPPARGCPTSRVREPARAASRGIPPRESFRALGP